MAWYRARKAFDWHDQCGKAVKIAAGQMVDVLQRVDVNRLLAEGYVEHPDLVYTPPATLKETVKRLAPGRKRILVWLPMQRHYSGGRIHIFQFAWCLAKLGNDVTVATNEKPPWWEDYPVVAGLRNTLANPASLPDVDVVIVDGKNPVAREGLDYCRANSVPLLAVNFETPNWFEQFCPDLVKHIQYHDSYKDLFRAANLALANSDESAKWLREWIGQDTPPIVAIPPAVNTTVDVSDGQVPAGLNGRKFCLISGRSDHYKHNEVSLGAVWEYAGQCDLVVVGGLARAKGVHDSGTHRMWPAGKVSDAAKFALMKEATLVLCPSRFEGFGMVPSEALSVGTPTLCYDLPVLRQEYGDKLHYSPWNKPAEFKAAAHRLLDATPAVLPEHQEWAKEHLGLDAMAERLDATPYLHSRRPSISAVMNAYACGTTVTEAMASVYDSVDELIVAYGREAIWEWPEDDTLDRLRSFPDPDGKVQIVLPPDGGDVWQGPSEDACRKAMRRACCQRVTGNFLLILDGDELWHGLDVYVQALAAGKIEGGCPLGVTFWHSPKHHILSSSLERWGERSEQTQWGTVWPHVRLIPWRYSYKWKTHVVPTDATGERLWKPEMNRHTVATLGNRCVLYHLGHALNRDFMKQKKQFYAEIEGQGRQRDAWLKWKGIAGQCDDGLVEEVTWELPPLVQQAFANIDARNAEPANA